MTVGGENEARKERAWGFQERKRGNSEEGGSNACLSPCGFPFVLVKLMAFLQQIVSQGRGERLRICNKHPEKGGSPNDSGGPHRIDVVIRVIKIPSVQMVFRFTRTLPNSAKTAHRKESW